MRYSTAPFVVTITEIIDATCGRLDVSPSDIMGRSRLRRHARARQVTWYVARQVTDMSYPYIARVFDRDHSTIVDGVQRIEKCIQHDADMLRLVMSITLYVQEQNLERIKQWQTTNSAKSMTSSERQLA